MPDNNALHIAAKAGILAEVQAQVRNFDINAKGEDDGTALFWAAREGKTEVVKLLLTHNADVNIPNKDNSTALTRAAYDGRTEIVKELLKVRDITVNHLNKYGTSALTLAAINGHTEIVKELLKVFGIEVNHTERNGDSALIQAARKGYTEIVNDLLKSRGININAKGEDDGTALLWAARGGKTQVVIQLLTHNADVNIPNKDNSTALTRAAYDGRTEIVKELLKVRGITVNHVNKYGTSALTLAAINGHTEIVKELLKVHGIEVNRIERNGDSALIQAARKGYTEIVKDLLKAHDININHTDRDGNKAIDVAETEEIKSLLRDYVPPPPYVGPAIMTFRDTSTSVLASGRTVDAHAAAATSEERAAQELALRLDALCRRGEFRDLSTVIRVLSKPTGQSVVFEGVYQGEPVAVKVFRDRTTGGTAAMEVAYLQRCAHRHVLRVLNTYEYNGRSLLVMPMARGDLQAVIERAEGPLPHARVTEYVKQVATALVFLHDEQRVAHLDLKAGNVFIAKSDGRVLLADFGMAMDIADINRDQLLACGTPMFQAPELWAQRLGDPVQRGNRAKVDVYAFGCIVWQLLTRQLPFQREIENDGWIDNKFLLLATAVRRERRSPADMLETRWPEPLRRVIQACCAYEPERRPTMAQVLAEYFR